MSNFLDQEIAEITAAGGTDQAALQAALDPYSNRWAADRGVSKVGGIRTVIFGDSMTALSGNIDRTGAGGSGTTQFVYDPTTGTSYYTGGRYINTADYGAFTWADALMGAPHYLLKNSGIGGENTDQMVARFDADCISLRPELVYLWAGRNDLKQGKTAAYVITNLRTMLSRLDAINAFVCLIDPPPSTDLNSVVGASAEAIKVAMWMRDEVVRRRQCVLASSLGVLANPDPAAGAAAITSLVLTDTVHCNNLGAFRMGQAIARVMGPILRKWEDYPKSPVEGWDFSNSADAEIRSSNPLMFGTAGTKQAGATGNVATGYDLSVTGGTTVVASKVAEAEGVGEAQRLVMTFAAAGERVRLGVTASIHARFVAGNRPIQCQADVRFSSDSAAIINRVEQIVSGTWGGIGRQARALSQVVSSDDQSLANNIQPLPLAGQFLRPRSYRALMAGSCTLWQHFIDFYASGPGVVTVDISRYANKQLVIT